MKRSLTTTHLPVPFDCPLRVTATLAMMCVSTTAAFIGRWASDRGRLEAQLSQLQASLADERAAASKALSDVSAATDTKVSTAVADARLLAEKLAHADAARVEAEADFARLEALLEAERAAVAVDRKRYAEEANGCVPLWWACGGLVAGLCGERSSCHAFVGYQYCCPRRVCGSRTSVVLAL